MNQSDQQWFQCISRFSDVSADEVMSRRKARSRSPRLPCSMWSSSVVPRKRRSSPEGSAGLYHPNFRRNSQRLSDVTVGIHALRPDVVRWRGTHRVVAASTDQYVTVKKCRVNSFCCCRCACRVVLVSLHVSGCIFALIISNMSCCVSKKILFGILIS